MAAALAVAVGALASVIPSDLAHHRRWNVARTERLSFLIYVVVAIGAATMYTPMRTSLPGPTMAKALHRSRAIVLRLSAPLRPGLRRRWSCSQFDPGALPIPSVSSLGRSNRRRPCRRRSPNGNFPTAVCTFGDPCRSGAHHSLPTSTSQYLSDSRGTRPDRTRSHWFPPTPRPRHRRSRPSTSSTSIPASSNTSKTAAPCGSRPSSTHLAT